MMSLPVKPMYLYLRTRTAISNRAASEALDSMAAAIEDAASITRQEVMGFGEDRLTWENGVVLRLLSPASVADVVADLSKALPMFDAWAIHDAAGDYAESNGIGPLTSFFESVPAGQGRGIMAQVFLCFGRDDVTLSDRIRSRFGCAFAPAFHFEDGQILLLHTRESGRTILRRCEREASKLEGFAVTDAEDVSFSVGGADIWGWVPLDTITFEDPVD